MLKISPLALTLVILRTTVHHAFISNSRPSPHILSSKNGASTIRTFSAILADSARDDAYVQTAYDANSEFENVEYESMMNKLTKMILSGEDFDAENLTTNDAISVLTHHSKRQTVEGAETIDKILDVLEEREDSGEAHLCRLHCGHYTIAVTAWSRSGHPDSEGRATRAVDRMKKRNVQLNEVTYNTWMHAYVNDIDKVEEILQEMEEKMSDEIRVADYNILIMANARQGRAKEAEQIVKSMVDRYMSEESEVLPDLTTYTMLLEAWSKSGEEGRGARAESILSMIEERYISSDLAVYYRDTAVSGAYVSAMRAIIHSGEEKIIERVESIYSRILERDITPDAFVYATLLDAYAISRPSDAMEKVQEIIAKLEENVSDNDVVGKTVVYNTALKMLRENRQTKAIAKAEELFEKMKSKGIIDEVTYGTMITLYANKGTDNASTKQIQDLLDEMESETGTKPNKRHINIAINAMVRGGNMSKATELLHKMEEEYENGNESMKPNVVSYTTLMNGWVKSNDPEMFEKATMLFDKMMAMFKSGNKDAEPNFVSYVTLVDCIVKSGNPGAAERAEQIVRNMYNAYTQGQVDFKPNGHLVSMVIDCWSKSGQDDAGERAEMLLDWLFEIYEKEKDPQLMPSAYPFASCISAWAKSRKFGKAIRARALLDKMKSYFASGVIKAQPNIYCYTAVMNACAYSGGDSIEKRDALQVFVTTYKEMINEKDVDPNNVTFSTALTALRNLLPPDPRRVDAVGSVFKKCVELGMCSSTVIKRLQTILDTEQLKDLVGDDKVNDDGLLDYERLPAEWIRNSSKPRKR